MNATERPSRAQSNASILLWQNRYRFILILGHGLITITLKWADILSADSVIGLKYGASRALTLDAAVVAVYLAFIAGLGLWMRAKRAVGTWAVRATLVADIVVIFGGVFVATPPEFYERALVLGMFSLLLTLLYFGWRLAAWGMVGMVGAFFAINVIAVRLTGGSGVLVETTWTLALFTVCFTVFMMLQADLGDRMGTILQIFERAREGDFSLTIDDEGGAHPDRITVIGASYDKMRAQLTNVILTDPLTQCFNPRGFDQLSMREIARAARSDSPLSMLALDVDHFKEVNDTFGHLVGDEVLREIGMLLRQTARLSDVVARTGGEEFAILAPDTDEHGAMLFAHRISEAFRAHRFGSIGDRKVTMSVGVAVASPKTTDVLRLLRARSDEALYAAKNAGRDRVEAWGEGKATRASQMNLRAIEE